MPPLSQHHSSSVTKLLLLGDSGSGKTGALASLAHAGYNLRILDLDNGVDVLFGYLTGPNSPYDKKAIERVQYRTLTEPMKNVGGQLMPVKATVWQEVVKMLTHWKEAPDNPDGLPTDLGPLTSWGSKDVLVIDSLTMLATAALNFHLSMQGALTKTRTSNEHRRDIGAAQGMLENLLVMLYDTSVKCNIVVNSHITYVAEGGTPLNEDGTTPTGTPMIGYPSAMGRALSPRIPRYFNSMLLLKTIGTGTGARHKIHTVSHGTVGAKSSAPLKVSPSYDISMGLAEYFKAVRGEA